MPAEGATPRERILTRPLLGFWLLVLLVVAAGLHDKLPRPDSRTAANLLRDGDLDGEERDRLFARLITLADQPDADAAALWLGVLAAIHRSDRPAHDRLAPRLAALGAGGAPDPTLRADLGMGDPLLANVAAALLAEWELGPDSARQHWLQVAEQCQLVRRPLAAELAADTLARLR